MKKTCINCGVEFEAIRKDKVYCNKSCKNNMWFKKNKLYKYDYDHKRRLENPEVFAKYTKEFRLRNPDKRYFYDKKLLQKSFKHRFYKSCLTAIKKSYLRGNIETKCKYFLFLNISYVNLKKHLISTLPLGYEWSDYLSGKLHIDHIKPHSLFEYESCSDESFKECWSINNLRLLEKEKNIKKSNYYED